MSYAERRAQSWRVRYTTPTGQHRTMSGFTTAQDALTYGREQEDHAPTERGA
ncbi:hypothetical protein [Streptosporangium longisporum]|uniref:AP2-like integrase N-terminal domain-containing protein n=1 Tax=Streptosporangium longisporum TaxID=46187 RepID=A0ABP6L2F9_9ACTN